MNKSFLITASIFGAAFIAAGFVFFISERTSPILNWEKLGGLPGGVIMGVSSSRADPEIVYIASNVDDMGVWKTEDFGKTWEKIFKKGHLRAIAAHPTEKNVVYVLGRKGAELWKTTDGGQTWTAVRKVEFTTEYKAENSFNSIHFSLQNPDVMVSGMFGKIAKSYDKGVTWEEKEVPFGGSVQTVIMHPENPSILYAGNDFILKSKDGGNNWTKSLEKSGVVKDIEIDQSNPEVVYAATQNGVFATKDGGESWENRGLSFVNDITIADGVILAAAEGGIYKSSDRGATWELLDGPFKDSAFVLVHSQDQNRLITIAAGWETWEQAKEKYRTGPYLKEGIFTSEDGGNTWEKAQHFYETDIYTLEVYGNTLFAGTQCSRGAFRSLDGGETWHYLEIGTKQSPNIMHYAMDIHTDGKLVVMTGRDGSAISYDNGTTWDILPIEGHSHGILKYGDIVLVGQSHHNNRPKYANIWKSEDGGKTWRVSKEGFPRQAETEIKVIVRNRGDNGIYLGTHGHHEKLPGAEGLKGVGVGIYRSFDDGETWTEFNYGLKDKNVTDIINAENLLYAAMSSGFYRLEGEEWVQLSERSFRDVEYDQENSMLYGAQGRMLFKSKDGVHWEELNQGWPKNEKWANKDRIENIKIANGKIYITVGQVGVYVADI